jgi:hypothetical protein
MRKVRPGFRNKIEKAASADHALIIRQDLRFRQIIELFVASPDFDETIFDRKAILTTLNAHYQGAANHADLLCSLATFAVGLSYFVYNRPTHSPPEAEPLANSLLA